MDVFALNASAWQQLLARRQQLPHALLLTGRSGTGLLELAQAYVAGLLCESKEPGRTQACGQCLACGWMAQRNHPDFRLLSPETDEEPEGAGEGKKKASQQIVIDQVRALDAFLNVGTHREGLRIILVHPAEAMNRNTANALLKMLEEPPPSTLFLLVSYESARLLPTIRSRCQVIAVPVPGAALGAQFLTDAGVRDGAKWLAMAGGAPLLAAQLAREGEPPWLEVLLRALSEGKALDPLGAAARLDQKLKEIKDGSLLRQVVEWTQKWALDLSLACQTLPGRFFTQQGATMQRLAGELDAVTMVRYCRQLAQRRREVEQPLNTRLFLEDFFLQYHQLFRQ